MFDLGGIKKSTRYVVSFWAQKRYIMFQQKSLFNLVKEFYKWIEGLGRSVIVRVQPEGERIFELIGIQKSSRYVVKIRAQKRAL